MTRHLHFDLLHPVFALLICASSATATDYRVTTYSDPVPDFCVTIDCSLREAVRAANQGGSADRIFLSAGTYTLSQAGADEDAALTGDLDILNDLEIIGAGATMTFIDAAGLDRVIQVLGAGTSVRIQDVSIVGGSGAAGGGVSVDGGSATIERVEIHDNAGPNGIPPGGLRVTSSGTLVLRESTLESNDQGGLTVSESTATLENVTIDENPGGHEIQVTGGGSVTCQHCTLRGLTTDNPTVQVSGNGSTIAFANSIVVGSCLVFNSGTSDSEGGNIESTGDTCGFDLGSDDSGVSNPSLGLGALGDHGGPTRTRVPSPSSVARDQGTTPGCLAKDQRGQARPVDGDPIPGAFCDVGAVEASTQNPPTPIFDDGVEQRSTRAWSDHLP